MNGFTKKNDLPPVYLLSVTEAALIPKAWCEERFPKRMERSRRFRREEDKLRSVAAGALEVYALGVDESGIRIDENGKPTAPESGYSFSLSHSGDYAVLALRDGEIGVDLEKIEDAHLRVAERVFTPEELCWMREEPKSRFCILWTLKESVCKLDGRGLSLPMESFSVLPLTEGGCIALNGKKLFGSSRIFETYALSLCTTKKTDGFALRILTAEDILSVR